jgi:CubicO group peptidase (beta-lactamase class C family)
MRIPSVIGRCALAIATAWALATVAALAFATLASAAEPPAPRDALDVQVDDWIAKGYYPWAGMLVYRGDELLIERYWGCYHRDGIANIASGTKLLEGATIMTVVDDGRLALDRPISTYLPYLSGDVGRVTIRQCLSHTSGLNKLTLPDDPAHPELAWTVEHGLTGVTRLADPPGTVFMYGGVGLGAAAAAAEAVAGEPFDALFRERIAAPLGLEYTTIGYRWARERAAGLEIVPYSTAHDYARVMGMLAAGGTYRGKRVLSEASVHEMMADQVRGARMPPDNFAAQARGGTHGCYGLTLWRETVDPQGEAVVVSCPGWSGFYPWIDRKRGIHGVFIARVSDAIAFQWERFHPMIAGSRVGDLAGAAVDALPVKR